MRSQWLIRTIGLCLFALTLGGCADLFQSLNARGEQFHDSMEERGVELHGGKAIKVYRF